MLIAIRRHMEKYSETWQNCHYSSTANDGQLREWGTSRIPGLTLVVKIDIRHGFFKPGDTVVYDQGGWVKYKETFLFLDHLPKEWVYDFLEDCISEVQAQHQMAHMKRTLATEGEALAAITADLSNP